MTLFDAEARAFYAGAVDLQRRNSLAVLFDMVPAGTDVLDVGIGGGALGRRLADERGCRVDGVTLSAEEAAQSGTCYRRIEVADLGEVALDRLFEGQRYGAIVCADVLEHLARPTQVLAGCRRLLADDGVLLISVPNVCYVGLLGELLGGEFRYRVEGLLDRTHLRFFTRRSLLRMLGECGWQVDLVEPIRVDLPDSEFSPGFDRLPPAVRRHLLSMPDGLAYQFVVRARPVLGDSADVASPSVDLSAETPTGQTALSPPHFAALLYLKGPQGYDESHKLVARGAIGDARQLIRFEFSSPPWPLSGLRLDPADRPGFLHLFRLRLLTADGELVWQWDDGGAPLTSELHQQVVFRTPWFTPLGTVLLLTGEDPFFELPLQPEQLHACGQGGVLEVDLAWPMSADYALFVDELTQRQRRAVSLEAQLAQAAQQRRLLDERVAALGRQIDEARQRNAERQALEREIGRLNAQCDTLAAAIERLRADSERLDAEADRLRDEALRSGSEVKQLRDEHDSARALFEAQRSMNDVLARELDAARRRLQQVESSRLFRLLSPLLQRTGAAQTILSSRTGASAAAALSDEVDVIVPVYRGLEESRTCIESVLASTPSTPFRLLVVNDASPEPEITVYLRDLAKREPRVTLIENAVNAGFVASVNRGMEFGAERDVVLLNSDAEVAGDWLDRLRRAAAGDARVGTVTPFSNSATICSYPRFCGDNPLPRDATTDGLDRLFAAANAGRTVEIPTAVGFCMFIRRSCLREVGLFDTERFGRGYGEENDFCMRARGRGWRHLLAMDVFVHHAGGVSFGAEKQQRVQQAQEILARLHPDYPTLIHKHLDEDPAQTGRLAVDVARLRASGLPSVLCVLHNTGGGTERHVRELAASVAGRANVLTLRPAVGGETLLEWLREGEAFRLGFHLPEEYESLVAALRALAVAHVHYHHLLGHSPGVWGLPKSLGVRHDFTAHDFYPICPQISLTDHRNRYCGELGVEQCTTCLQRSPAPGGVSIDTWRDGFRPLLEHARFVLTPSDDTAGRLRRHFPEASFAHVPHADMADPPPTVRPLVAVEGRPLRIVVIGALSPIKGADVLEAVAVEAARRNLALDFHLLGFAYRSLLKLPRARLTVHGQYEESELGDLLAWLKPDLAWFPALWPETYSYTLSACLKAALPIVAPHFGAFAERLHGRAWTWLCPWDRPASEWADFFERLRSEHFAGACGPQPAVGVVAKANDFSYRRDYLRGVAVPLSMPLLSHEFLDRQRPGRKTDAVGRRSKRMLLALAVRLRRAPWLRGVARRVPLRWQTRARVWLSS